MGMVGRIGLPGVGLALALAGGASATEELTPEPTRRYEVTAVAPGDRLNIREQPGPSAPVIATLAPDAGGLTVAGTRIEIGGSVWWQAITDEGTGWVNARFLTPGADGGGGQEGFPLRCAGTEPFWSLDVKGEEARFERPGVEGRTWQAGPMTYAPGLLGRFAVPLRDEQGTGHLAAWRNHRFCSDGMSDIQHPFESIVITPAGDVFAGCCRRSGR